MRMLYWPLRSPTNASNRFPGNAARSLSDAAASIRSSFKRADRSNPENALTRFPTAKSLLLLSRKLTITTEEYLELRVTSSVRPQNLDAHQPTPDRSRDGAPSGKRFAPGRARMSWIGCLVLRSQKRALHWWSLHGAAESISWSIHGPLFITEGSKSRFW